ncbi:putative signaling protein [Microcoleus sp. IPMA8]|uniref:Signaling protein n=2 Tax=Microcoleus TaxID=44471 RepID=A0ABX2D6Q9_9CYAN|nr:bifunctional diguanylate cyclase/phosphodiesterase [Microcoleus asticus]NQE37590.1 putative signaling protein [Microcoleus asticus IPMA8]
MQLKPNLNLYSSLGHLPWLKKSYTAKIMVVAFLGTHVPLLTLMVWFLTSNAYSLETSVRVLLIALLATLAGTAATLYTLRYLLVPVILTSEALQNYLDTKTLPNLPTEFADEVGTLMANSSQTLYKLDELIDYITHYDKLTGLPNRDLFCDRLNQTRSQNHSSLVAVLVLGIDDLTGMRHGLEPGIWDLLIRAVSQRVVNCIDRSDLLARLGDGEFAIARSELPSLESVVKLSQLLLSTLAKPFSIEGQPIHLTASLGITLNHLENTNSAEQLLQQAHFALHQAKQQGQSHYQFYSPEMNVQLQERLLLENSLRGALDRNELLVYYQPLIDLDSGQVTATEALVRWQHSTEGLVSPAKFIPIAEANGEIVPIGEWVLRTACAQTRRWQLAGMPALRISVNLSARQFEQANLVEMVRQILAQTELEAAYLELEVTETALMTDIERSVKTLLQLRELGVSLALDDFGTGYSSLNYLQRFPVNMLKIDRSFVRDVLSNPNSATITDAIIALAKSLRLTITAEGIETKEQRDYLQARGCDEGQGFYFSRPANADTIAKLLNESFQSDAAPMALATHF